MSTRYEFDYERLESIHAKRAKSRPAYVLASFVLLIPVAFLSSQVSAFLAAGLVLYWAFDYWSTRSQRSTGFREYSVEVSADALELYMVESDGAERRLKFDWPLVSIGKVVRSGGEVSRIQLLNNEMPKGARSFPLEGFKDMAGLLADIESRIGASK